MPELKRVPREILDSGAPNPFSQEIPNLQIMWDSTSLGALKRCPRYYYYTMLEGLESRIRSIHLTFGILYHKAMEIYDKERVGGATHEQAQDEAVRYALEASVEHDNPQVLCENCGHYGGEPGTISCSHCGDDLNGDIIHPWRDLLVGLSQKGRVQLVRSVVWYTEQFKNDTMQTLTLQDGKAAVELSFTLPLDFGPENSDEIYSLRGHLDKAAENDTGLWIVDKKTTKSALYESYFEGFSPDNQVTLYTLAGKMVLGLPLNGVVIDGAQLGVSFTRFNRGYIHRTTSQLEEWLDDLQIWLKNAEMYARADHWPQNEQACGLYGGCPFRHVCGRSPEVRDSEIRHNYTHRIWNPAEDR